MQVLNGQLEQLFQQYYQQLKATNPTISESDARLKFMLAIQSGEITLPTDSAEQKTSVTTPIVTDTSDAKSTTLKTLQSGKYDNIRLLGQSFSDAMTKVGVSTGNPSLAGYGQALLGITSNLQLVRDFSKLVSAAKADYNNAKASGNKSLTDITKNTLSEARAGRNAAAGNIMGSVADGLDNALFSGVNSQRTSGLQVAALAFDSASNIVMMANPLIGGLMKAGGLVADGLDALGLKTDAITKTDEIMDSKPLKLLPTTIINDAFAKRTHSFSVNSNLRSAMGSSYTGTYDSMDEAASKANKKVGLFSQWGGAYSRINKQIDKASTLLGKIENINNEAQDRFGIAANSSQLNATRYLFNVNGGLDSRYLLRAKSGGNLKRIKKLNLAIHKQGGIIETKINLDNNEPEWLPQIILKSDTIIYAKEGTKIEEDEWQPVLYKDGGKTEEYQPLTEQQNVIPDGALHKNKHHMDNALEWTKKGIPVIDNDNEQLAEIELNEIIFSLEVTKKLEDLYKSYSHYDTSNKEKDNLAIEAGKLLVLEILFNTKDNTGLIDSLKLGGTIDGNIK